MLGWAEPLRGFGALCQGGLAYPHAPVAHGSNLAQVLPAKTLQSTEVFCSAPPVTASTVERKIPRLCLNPRHPHVTP
jgi:hypothetical protein